jgi:uncharacterized protein YjiS (DUF1127 family)
MQTFLAQLASTWQRFTCRVQEARRLRRHKREFELMSAHELRDIGFSHPAMAYSAAANGQSRCI